MSTNNSVIEKLCNGNSFTDVHSNENSLFFNSLFMPFFDKHEGYIELRIFDNGKPRQTFHDSIESAVDAVTMTDPANEVYFGVAPRSIKGGRKEAVSFVQCLWSDVDYGNIGHKKPPAYRNRAEAMAAIKAFPFAPSIVIHTGGGFQVYWILNEIYDVMIEERRKRVEEIMRGISRFLKADSTHDVSRIFRVPGTMNNKIQDNPRPVEIVSMDTNLRYNIECFDIFRFALSPKMLDLSFTSDAGGYASRSEADAAVILALVNAGATDEEITTVFEYCPRGEKYLEKGEHGQAYLNLSITKARKLAEKKSVAASSKAKKGINTHAVVDAVLSKDNLLFIPELGFNIWIPKGVWGFRAEEYILQIIEQHLSGRGSKRYDRNEVLAALKIHPEVLLSPEMSLNSRREMLNITNGMLHLETMELLPHSPEYLSTIQMPVAYNPEANCPRWRQFVVEVLPDESDRLVLQEMFGYCLTVDTHHEKAFVLIGKGANGKSVAIETLAFIIGEDNTSRVQPCEIGKQFCTIRIMNKLLNICSELESHELISTATIKALISGEPVEDAFKFKDRIVFTPFAKLVFGTNIAPRVTDRSEGFYRRLQFINFPVTFDEDKRDKRLKEKFRDEADGIFLWALEGLRRLRAQNGFTKSETSKVLLEEYRLENNAVAQFAEECLDTSDSTSQLTRQQLYDGFSKWVALSGCRQQSKASFFKLLRHEIQFEDVRMSSGRRARCVAGIKIKPGCPIYDGGQSVQGVQGNFYYGENN